MNERERAVFGAILGEKKVAVIEYLVQNADENGFINLKIDEICVALNISKPTTINTFKILAKAKALTRIKNGVYRLNTLE